MAFVQYIAATPPLPETINPTRTGVYYAPYTATTQSSPIWSNARKLSLLSSTIPRSSHRGGWGMRVRAYPHPKSDSAKAKLPESEAISAADTFTQFKHILLPVTDKNPYLSEGTRQATATAASLAKKYEADITVVVIDEDPKESVPEHDTKLSSVRWHLSEGGFQEFRLIERLGEGKKPTAIISEVADDMNLDLVVMSMEAIHSKHIDANLLAEFIPCPVLLLPL